MGSDATGESVTIEYELTRKEVISVLQWHLLHVTHIVRKVLLSVIALVLVPVAFFLNGGSVNIAIGWALFGLVLSTLMSYGFLYYVAPRRAWERIMAEGPRVLQFNDVGVRDHTRNSHVSNLWAAYSEFIETQEIYLLRSATRKGIYTYAPERAFRSSSDELAFRALGERLNLQRSAPQVETL